MLVSGTGPDARHLPLVSAPGRPPGLSTPGGARLMPKGRDEGRGRGGAAPRGPRSHQHRHRPAPAALLASLLKAKCFPRCPVGHGTPHQKQGASTPRRHLALPSVSHQDSAVACGDGGSLGDPALSLGTRASSRSWPFLSPASARQSQTTWLAWTAGHTHRCTPLSLPLGSPGVVQGTDLRQTV